MTSSEYSLQSYFDEIRPIIEEFNKSRKVINRFEESLYELRLESRKCNDTLTVVLCWQDNIARQLRKFYAPAQLLELHGIKKGEVRNTGNIFTLTKEDGNSIKFYLCKHLIYTPIPISPSINQCLRC